MATIEKLSSGSYRVRIRSNGVKEDKTCKTYEEAETYRLRRQSEVLALRSNAIAKNIKDTTIAELVALYFQSSAYLRKKESTRKTETIKAKQILAHFAEYPISQISSNMLQDYFDKRALMPSMSNGRVRNERVSSITILNRPYYPIQSPAPRNNAFHTLLAIGHY